MLEHHGLGPAGSATSHSPVLGQEEAGGQGRAGQEGTAKGVCEAELRPSSLAGWGLRLSPPVPNSPPPCSAQGRPGMNGLKGEKGEPGDASLGFGMRVSIL